MSLEQVIARLQHSNSANLQNMPSLDGFRGIAILLVVLGHYWSIACEKLPARAPVLLWGIDITNFFMLAGHGVEIFFILSAFLLYLPFVREPLQAKATERIRKFYWRRFLRIYPAFFICALFGVIILAFFGTKLFIPRPSLLNLFSNLIFIQPITVFLGDGSVSPNILDGTWSLVVEVYFYMLLPVLAIFTKRTASFVAVSALMVLVALAYRIHVYPLIDPMRLSWQQNAIALLNIFPYLDAFALGMISARMYVWLAGLAKPVPPGLKRSLVYLPLIGLGYVASHPFQSPVADFAPGFLRDPPLFFNFCVAILLLGLLLSKSYVSWVISLPILRFTGIVSYSVFLIHISFVRFVVSPVLEMLQITRYEEKLVILLVVAMPLAIALGTVFYILIERPFLSTSFSFQRQGYQPVTQPPWTEGSFLLRLKWVPIFLLCWYGAGSFVLSAATKDKEEVFLFTAADYSDANWRSGIATDGKKLLVPFDKVLFHSLVGAKYIVLENGNVFEIFQVIQAGSQWMHVYFSNSTVKEMAYPNRLVIVKGPPS